MNAKYFGVTKSRFITFDSKINWVERQQSVDRLDKATDTICKIRRVVTSIKMTINFDKNSTLSRIIIIHILPNPRLKLPGGRVAKFVVEAG